MVEPLKEVEDKVLVRTMETEIGGINVYRLNRLYSELEIERQKKDFYALIARLLLSDGLGFEVESV